MLFTSAGYVMLIPLIEFLAGDENNIQLLNTSVEPEPGLLFIVVCAIVILVFAGVRLSYSAYLQSINIMRATIIDTAAEALHKLHYAFPEMTTIKAVTQVLNNLSFSCGNVMRLTTEMISRSVTVPLYILVLAWLQPFLTLIVIGLMLITSVYVIRTMRGISYAVENRKSVAGFRKKDQKRILSIIRGEDSAGGTLEEAIGSIFEDSEVGKFMDIKLDIRRDKRKAPLMIDYLLPVSIIILVLVMIIMGDLRSMAPSLVAFLFILRNLYSAVKGVTFNFATLGKYYSDLRCYQKLVYENDFPNCLSGK